MIVKTITIVKQVVRAIGLTIEGFLPLYTDVANGRSGSGRGTLIAR